MPDPVSLPRLLLSASALDTNLRTMAEWCSRHETLLFPHVKTTMCRPIVDRQMAAGATGVTVATLDQAETVIGWGQTDVLIANEVVGAWELTRLRHLYDSYPDVIVRCFVDSDYGVDAAAAAFTDAARRLDVLVDVGRHGGRTGVRSVSEGVRLARRLHRSPALRLVGVAGYEGVVPNSRDDGTVASIDKHCARVREVFDGALEHLETDTPIFSMGGSAFPDRAVEFFPTESDAPGVVRLLRSGCYATHDHGTYARTSPIQGLLAALAVEAVVLSTPERGLVVLGAGKRDVPYDAGYPVLLSATSPQGDERTEISGEVTSLFDHHAVLTHSRGLHVGDIVRLGISHPCSAFDRWPDIAVTGLDGRVVEHWPTDFSRVR